MLVRARARQMECRKKYFKQVRSWLSTYLRPGFRPGSQLARIMECGLYGECLPVMLSLHSYTFSAHMRVMNHNWSATKQHFHLQSVAEISCHSVLSGDRIRHCGTSSGSRHKDTDQCL